jgi:ribonuclease HII
MKSQTKDRNQRRGVIGIDEVGRGPLAGPVTVCACYIEDEKEVRKEMFGDTVRDSKKLKKSLRSSIYQTIRYKRYLNGRIEYAVSSRSAAYIDRHGISKAVKQCLVSCVRSLERKGVQTEGVSIKLDAGLHVPLPNLSQKSFVKGDERYTEIALASILAKVSRDAYMEKLSLEHGEYAWHKNAGYGTKEHCKAIEKKGVTKFHRRTYLKGFKLFDKAE